MQFWVVLYRVTRPTVRLAGFSLCFSTRLSYFPLPRRQDLWQQWPRVKLAALCVRSDPRAGGEGWDQGVLQRAPVETGEAQ